jgi:LL-diaminopimelate aminotransferase
MRLSHRVERLPPYLFVEISRKIAEKRAQGVDLVTFAIGDPDLPTPPHVIARLIEAAHDPANHRYPETEGLPELRQAIADWYGERFGISLDPQREVAPLIGSKEGIAHIALCLLDPGDVALVPDPGYPVYAAGTLFAGGEVYAVPLVEEKGYLPDLEAIPPAIAQRAKVLWLNYPNNPTGAVADLDFFERAVHFARRYELILCHDAAYTEVAYDGYRPPSLLQAPGARSVSVEFHSLSKSYNMTGWRIGMAVGEPMVIDALLRLKSNLDSGIPQAIQYAAIAALRGPQECIAEHNAVYQRRRDRVVAVLREMGLRVTPPKASLYVWAPVPEGYTSIEYTTLLLEEAAVVVTPGVGYGQYGEGYIRLSLTTPDDRLEEGLRRLQQWASMRTALA